MKKLSLLICLTLVSGFAFAQWTWQNPLPQGNTLNCVRFVDTNIGYAVGDVGTIIKTTDGGLTWTIQNSGTTADLYSVFFLDALTGYAVGHIAAWNGCILKTTDGGATWTNKPLGYESSFWNAVFFTSIDTGYAGGSTWGNRKAEIQKTTDGGKTWTSQAYGNPITLGNISSLFFTNSDTGYAIGTTLLRTTDGGVSWTDMNNTSGNFVFFTDTNTGYVVGDYGKIQKTTDGGATWALQHTDSTYYLTSVFFTDSITGYAVGGDYGLSGIILKTTDAGANWIKLNSGDIPHLGSVYFQDTNTGYAVGKNGTILKSSDGGTEWHYLSSSITSKSLSSTFFLDANTGYAVGERGTIIKTNDGGTLWTLLNSGTSKNLGSVYFTNFNTGYAVGDSGCILKTINEGTTWTPQSSGASVSLCSVYFPIDNIGYAVGDSMVFSTKDGGIHWTGKSLLGAKNDYLWLDKIYFVNKDTGIVVGGGMYGFLHYTSNFYRTMNGGLDWTLCDQIDSYGGYEATSITSHNHVINKTTDDGLTWTSSYCGFTASEIYYSIPGSGNFITAEDENFNGVIHKTTDGGITWTDDLFVTSNLLNSVFFPDKETGYVVGANGTILKTTNGGGLVSIKETKAPESSFSIYPNPATNKISIATSSNLQGETTICIFNMNGALLQQEKFQSQNLIEMDVSALAKGFYLVKIQIRKGIETKKLVVQ
jgi:photosystem II stability/assembly factor-like uncharacterized protein